MNFYDTIGKVALGTRLRMLSEQIMEEAGQVYQLYGVDLRPKWFPVFYVLSRGQAKAITIIAEEIGQSHPAVIKTVQEMTKAGLVIQEKDSHDGRRNLVCLSEKGATMVTLIEPQYADVEQVIDDLLAQTNHNLWEAVAEWEFLLKQQTLRQRIQRQKKQRESQGVVIIPYEPRYQEAFKALNEAWISTYFTMEEADHKALDHPQTYILDNGGYIKVALLDNEPIGVCALIAMRDHEYDFELAKMAVASHARGKNVGWLLGQAIIEQARLVGAKKLFLESNTVLQPAINLYHKLGFQKVSGYPTPYQRCNIQMALLL